MSRPFIFCGLSPASIEYTNAPGPGSRWMLVLSCRMRMPPVRRFWVIVANLPPPVPRKTSSSAGVGVVMVVFRLTEVWAWLLICVPLELMLRVGCKFYFSDRLCNVGC